ncbi:MAG: hypothetical protein M1822_004824 [Bathelium mastoideum]|nr:MAG: hypothetical protein M1822_004824 [Bathelium mastoideum]
MANPMTSILGPDQQRTLVYYITSDRRLALDQYPYDSGYSTEIWSANTCPQTASASLLTPNHLSAVQQYGMTKVYGMVQPAADTPSYVISELSPTIRFASSADDKDSITTQFNQLAVVCDGADSTWFYYFAPQSTVGPMKLKVGYRDQKQTFWNFELLDNALVGVDSTLAAIYLPETRTRLVFFQTPTNFINVATVTDDQIKIDDVNNSNNAFVGTPMAVSYTGDENNRTIYLFHMSNINGLARATGRWDGNSWKWQLAPLPLATTKTLSPATQLSVTFDGTNNRIYYIQKNASRYTQIIDPLPDV